MSTALERPTGVPRESLGQARALRNQLVTDDGVSTVVLERIAAPLHARTRKGCIPHPELLADAAIQWREKMDGPGRLGLDVQESRNRLTIRELRLSAADFQLPGWDQSNVEAGFAVLVVALSVQRRTLKFDRVSLASVSLHAIARWYQRAWRTTPDALAADVATLATAIDKIDLVGDQPFSVPVSYGRWAGTVQEVLEEEMPQMLLCVRTFLTP